MEFVVAQSKAVFWRFHGTVLSKKSILKSMGKLLNPSGTTIEEK